jgi:hypothetical protein
MKKALLFILACMLSLGIYAQDSNSELLKKLVEKQVLTQDEANEIAQESTQKEKKTSFSENVEKVRSAFNTPYLQFGGYGLLTYKYNQYSKNHHDFKPRAVFISMNGKLTKTISYGILAEFADPALYEFYGEWTPAKWFSFKAGQFKVPFSLENPISTSNLETIYNTRTISSLVGMGDDVLKLQNKINGVGRDIGVQASGSFLKSGDHDLLQYTVGVFQGSGINISDRDNYKDFSGILLLQPIKGFRIGGSAYFGEATYTLNEETTPATSHVRNRWAISSDYQSDRFCARAEWIHGKDGVTKKEGLYGLALYYLVPKKLNVVGKVDYFNKDKDNNSEVMDYTVGLNYYFYTQCRLQVNYTYSDYSCKWNTKNNNMVAAQMQIVF